MTLAELLGDPDTRAKLDQIARRYGVAAIRVFGSVARGEATPASDIDLLVSFEEGRHPGWLVFDLQRELEELLRRKVDLSTEAMWREERRRQVLREAEAIYG
jgi:predicted nucleotidyltransferase